MINQPEGDALLEEARRALMERLLPALPPGDAYTARMVARAMGIAARELRAREALRADSAAAIGAFLAQAGLDGLPADERTLSRLIRERRLPEHSRRELPGLLMTLTRRKLAISNPRYAS
jgi:hypothetical protein